MIVNMLRFTFKAETSDEQKARVLATLRRTAAVESVSFSTVGQDLGDPADGYTHAYCVGLNDLSTVERYMHDSIHIDGDWEIIPHIARLARYAFSDDMDPDLDAKLAALHQAKVEAYPEWGRLLTSIPEVRL